MIWQSHIIGNYLLELSQDIDTELQKFLHKTLTYDQIFTNFNNVCKCLISTDYINKDIMGIILPQYSNILSVLSYKQDAKPIEPTNFENIHAEISPWRLFDDNIF